MASRRAKFRRGVSRAGGIFGIKSAKDVGEVAVTSAGSNYFANVIATAVGMSNHRFLRPLIAGGLAFVMSRRTLRNATVIGAVLIAMTQAGFNIPILSNMQGRVSGGTNNPQRGQQGINQLNTLGRLP